MSMLTPPGMGGKYRVTGTQYPRMRRTRSRGRIVASTVAVTVALSFAGWGTLQLIDTFGGRSGSKKANAAPASCRRSTPSATASAAKAAPSSAPSSAPSAAALPKPGAITVNVYNATSKSGLAKSTADALAARGFKIGTFGNAPATYDKKVMQSALLVGGAKAGPALSVVSAQITGTATKTDPKLAGTTVDLMIGKAFTKLSSDAQVKQALTALAHPSSAAGSTGKAC